MASIEKTVFISYRRTDVYTALAVYENLKNQGYDVFFDYRSIPSGDFEQIITSNIKARAHFLLILTPTALDRCKEPGDWLRREIEIAIDEKRNIVPLFFKGFKYGADSSFGLPRWLRKVSASKTLTGKLKNLSRYNGMNVHEDYFDEAMHRLRTQFLNLPLNTILHPVTTDVQKVVKEEQIAADKALEQIEDVKALIKLREDKPRKVPLSFFGIAASVLVFLVSASAAMNAWTQKSDGTQTPTRASPTVTNTIALDAPVKTPTTGILPSTATNAPTHTAIPSPTRGIGSTLTGTDGMTLQYVPAGEFTMGSDSGTYYEKPAHLVYLDAFWIDKTEVTNKMYVMCVSAGICQQQSKLNSSTRRAYQLESEFGNYPVIYVDWSMAKSYCEWAGRRLPTEAEWEKAARGTDERIYPWGNDAPNSNLLNYDMADTTTVGAYPEGISPYGALDMVGNVLEWVADRYDEKYYANSPKTNPLGPDSGVYRVLRGGTWYLYGNPNGPDWYPKYIVGGGGFTTLDRLGYTPDFINFNIGFRCAMDATP